MTLNMIASLVGRSNLLLILKILLILQPFLISNFYFLISTFYLYFIFTFVVAGRRSLR
jgi:hypothetical protein